MTWVLRQPGACTCPGRPDRMAPAVKGDLWECDDCGQLWEYTRFGGGSGGVWMHAGRKARRRAQRIKLENQKVVV